MTTSKSSIEVFTMVPLDGETQRLPKGYVSVADAAMFLRVSDETVRRWIAGGKLDAEQVQENARGREGWRWVVPTSALTKARRRMRAVTHQAMA